MMGECEGPAQSKRLDIAAKGTVTVVIATRTGTIESQPSILDEKNAAKKIKKIFNPK